MPKKDFTITKDAIERFVVMMEEVMQEYNVSKEKFGKSIHRSPQNIAPLERIEQEPTLTNIVLACTEWGYSANWLLLGIGPKKLDRKEAEPLEQRVNNLESEIRKLKRLCQQAFMRDGASHNSSHKKKISPEKKVGHKS